ncbi:LOW QUALITY PROTEIN: nck-associated protein 5-like, partial [Cygnus olor]|uniref:LOW QUALITY PROTEIN: nck-associated protein 5-like n=1 Tax=Cygnus olor TaxID=8869 RepID=UPI001ADDFEA1
MSESAAEAQGDESPAARGETGTSHELLQRLRELEAENSALAQANENQRETYERCLDEVANHVVQALLNQKDLREECIKLKKRVFDLERQNQALSDLFQQKLQLSAGSLPQLPLHPVPVSLDAPGSPQLGSTEQPPALLPPGCCAPPAEATPVGPSGSPVLSPGAPSLDALSPFFKKKAQILEVLRKLEETDPLLGPPSGPPHAQGPPDSPCSPEPRAGADAPGWAPSCPLRGLGAAAGWRGAEGSPCSSPEEAAPPRGALLSALAERLLRGDGGCCRLNGEAPGPPRQRGGGGPEHPAFLGLYAPCEESPEGGFAPLSPRLGLPSPGGGAPPLTSPSKVLKALKLPGPPGVLRLSPQLARASKIPCRSSNPEASPVLSRRASPDAPPEPGSPEPPGFPLPHAYEAAEQPLGPLPAGPPAAGERAAASPPSPRRGAGGSAPSRRPGKKPPEPGYLPFKERLAALGKLRGADSREPPGPGRPERGHGAEPRPPARGCLGGQPDTLSRRTARSPWHGATPPAPWASTAKWGARGAPPVAGPRRAPPPPPPAKAARSPHGSPTKLPTKAAGKTGGPRGEEPKAAPAAAAAGAAKAAGGPRKAPPGPEALGAGSAAGAAGHSAIEEKVMKGIEENVLRLQGQERAPAAEVKVKPAGGLASWFGLRRSKLPALSRRAEGARGREWSGAPAPLRREVKLAARKLEAESLNISKLMEKAEDLRKALQEEQAFLHGLALDKGRPRARGPGPERSPGQLQVMYQEVTAENFMQQLLNRVDGKDVSYESRLEHKRDLCDFQRVSPDAKDPRLCRPPRNGIVGHLRGCQEPPDKVPDVGLRDELPSDESLSESGTSQHFAACGSLTRTLDSGIGTFPPPDYGGAPAKSAPKPRGRPEPLPGAAPARPAALTKVPRKARTLEREVPSVEELLVPGKHRSVAPSRATAPPSAHSHRGCPQDADAEKPRRVQQSKNWTFPNAKACGAPDPFLCPPGGLEGLHQPALAPVCSPAGHRGASPEAPPPLPPALSACSSRTPSASDVGDEGSTEARSRDAGCGPPRDGALGVAQRLALRQPLLLRQPGLSPPPSPPMPPTPPPFHGSVPYHPPP